MTVMVEVSGWLREEERYAAEDDVDAAIERILAARAENPEDYPDEEDE